MVYGLNLKNIIFVLLFFPLASYSNGVNQFWYESGFKDGVKSAYDEIHKAAKYHELDELNVFYRFCRTSGMEDYFRAYDKLVFKNTDASSYFKDPDYSNKILGKAKGFCEELHAFMQAKYRIPYGTLYVPEK
jgi:hypothetical protein